MSRRVLSLDVAGKTAPDSIGRGAGDPNVTTLTLYSRRGCHLCDDTAAVLRALAGELVIVVEVVDIDADTALRACYDHHVPVLCHNGSEICRHTLDLPALEQYLIRAREPADR